MKRLQTGQRLIIGRNSVREVLRWSSDRIISILCNKPPAAVLGMENAADFEWQKIDFDKLTELVNSDSHQGIAVIVKEQSKLELKAQLKELAEKERATIVLLSSLQDPHHLGAIFRAAEVFGADLIVWSGQHCPGVTAAVSKVAVGATELVPFCEVSNINEALRKCKTAGFWTVAAQPASDEQDLNTGNSKHHDTKCQNLSKFKFPMHTALVLGAEGEGIPRLTLELSDFQVAIEQGGKIDSCSLSQAAAIFLYEIKRQQLTAK